MTREYIRDEEHPIPTSDATLLDLALAQLMLPDSEIDSKSLHLPSGLRRALRDYVIEMRAETFAIKGLKLGAKTLARAYVQALKEINNPNTSDLIGFNARLQSDSERLKSDIAQLKEKELAALAGANDFYWHGGES